MMAFSGKTLIARLRRRSNIRTNTLPVLAGIVAPILFVSIFTIDGIFQKDYDAMRMHVSALSLGQLGWIQIINFMIFGSLLFIFSLKVLKDFRNNNKSKVGPLILLVSAIFFFLSGPFVMDPMGTEEANMTVPGIVHGLVGGILFMLMPITCFIFYFLFSIQT